MQKNCIKIFKDNALYIGKKKKKKLVRALSFKKDLS